MSKKKCVCVFFVLLVDLSLSFVWCKHIETQKEMGLPLVQMLTHQQEREREREFVVNYLIRRAALFHGADVGCCLKYFFLYNLRD